MIFLDILVGMLQLLQFLPCDFSAVLTDRVFDGLQNFTFLHRAGLSVMHGMWCPSMPPCDSIVGVVTGIGRDGTGCSV